MIEINHRNFRSNVIGIEHSAFQTVVKPNGTIMISYDSLYEYLMLDKRVKDINISDIVFSCIKEKHKDTYHGVRRSRVIDSTGAYCLIDISDVTDIEKKELKDYIDTIIMPNEEFSYEPLKIQSDVVKFSAKVMKTFINLFAVQHNITKSKALRIFEKHFKRDHKLSILKMKAELEDSGVSNLPHTRCIALSGNSYKGFYTAIRLMGRVFNNEEDE